MQRLNSSLRCPNLRGLPGEYASAIRWRHQWHRKRTEPFTGFAQQRRHYNSLQRLDTSCLWWISWNRSKHVVGQQRGHVMCVCVFSYSSVWYALNMAIWWHADMHICLIFHYSKVLKSSLMPFDFSPCAAKECQRTDACLDVSSVAMSDSSWQRPQTWRRTCSLGSWNVFLFDVVPFVI